MSIDDRILAAYPDANPTTDYLLKDDGNGPYLVAWNIVGPLPTGVTMGQTAVQLFQGMHGTVRTTAQTLIRQIEEIDDIIGANPQIAIQAAAAEAGGLIGETAMTKEEVLAGLALIANFLAYIDTNLFTGVTIRQAVYRAA